MQIAIGAVLGLLWGGAFGLLNGWILKKAVGKGASNAVLAANLGRMAIDLVALGSVFLLRGLLPIPYEPVLIATAVALSLMSILTAFRYGKKL